jgi:mono/diheme cytochrome c family protein
MRRYVIAMTAVLMMTVPLVMSRLGDSQAQEKPKGNVEAGKALYATHCKKCHGAEGQGNPAMYKRVKATVVHLGSKQAQDKSDAEIRKSMTHGFGKMEAVKELNAEQIEHILAFTRTLKQ